METLIRISNPKLWIYSIGLYILGIIIALSQFPKTSLSFASFFLYGAWFLLVGIVMGFSHSRKTSKLIFPWHIIKGVFQPSLFLNIIKSSDIEKIISTVISYVVIIVFCLLTFLFPNTKIFLIALQVFTADFFYNSNMTQAKYKPLFDIICSAVYIIPLTVGYTMAADIWPNGLLITAGIFYVFAIELFGGIIDISYFRGLNIKTSAVVLGSRGALLVSSACVCLSGILAAFYSLQYFILIVPFMIVLLLALYIRKPERLLALYSQSFWVHSFWAFFVGLYYSAIRFLN